MKNTFCLQSSSVFILAFRFWQNSWILNYQACLCAVWAAALAAGSPLLVNTEVSISLILIKEENVYQGGPGGGVLIWSMPKRKKCWSDLCPAKSAVYSWEHLKDPRTQDWLQSLLHRGNVIFSNGNHYRLKSKSKFPTYKINWFFVTASIQHLHVYMCIIWFELQLLSRYKLQRSIFQ